VGIAQSYRDNKKKDKHANKNFPTNTVHSCKTERHFTSKVNCAQVVQVLGINKREVSQELELLKYAYSS